MGITQASMGAVNTDSEITKVGIKKRSGFLLFQTQQSNHVYGVGPIIYPVKVQALIRVSNRSTVSRTFRGAGTPNLEFC